MLITALCGRERIPLDCYIIDAKVQIQGGSNELSCGIYHTQYIDSHTEEEWGIHLIF